MARRLNFTGRRKIKQADATVQIVRRGESLAFDAELRLAEYRLDPTALVHVEAYRGSSTLWKRFGFGRVGLLQPPADRSLDEFGEPGGILFRVKVAADGEARGKLLAEADKIRPRLPDDEELPGTPLLKTEPGDIGSEPWRLRFDDDLPVLVINKQTTGWKQLVAEPIFRALVAPAAMRQILTQFLIIECELDKDDETDWRTRWTRFAESLPGVPGHRDDVPQPDVEDWIDTAVSAFAARSGVFEQFLQLRQQEIPS